MIEPWQLAFALILDLLLGDPRSWPHPAKLTGRLAIFWERAFRRLKFDGIFAGACFWLIVVAPVIAVYLALDHCLSSGYPLAADLLGVLVIYQCIAARDLWDHVRTVQKPLLTGDLESARTKLSLIVGRDTENLDETEITRAAIETTAESYNDGFLAPLFWTLLFGPAGALLFRCANTLDSMVGHRDEEYERFGKISARFDDVLAWLPARLGAFLIWPAGILSIRQLRREANQHASPNAGWPEAAMAHALNCRLGGTNTYDGQSHPGPVFNSAEPAPTRSTLSACLKIYRASFLRAAAISLLSILALNPRLHHTATLDPRPPMLHNSKQSHAPSPPLLPLFPSFPFRERG